MSTIRLRVTLVSLLAAVSLTAAVLPASAAETVGPFYYPCNGGTKLTITTNSALWQEHRVDSSFHASYPGGSANRVSNTTYTGAHSWGAHTHATFGTAFAHCRP